MVSNNPFHRHKTHANKNPFLFDYADRAQRYRRAATGIICYHDTRPFREDTDSR